MKAFCATLLAATAAAATNYTKAGSIATGITSSKVTITLNLSTTTTLDVTTAQQAVMTAAMVLNDKVQMIACWTDNAAMFICVESNTIMSTAANYQTSYKLHSKITAPVAAAANATSLTPAGMTNNFNITGVAIAAGTATAAVAPVQATALAGYVFSMVASGTKLSTDKKTMDTSIKCVDTGSTAAVTTAKETAAKAGMATTLQGVYHKLAAGTAASTSVAVALVAGSLSTVATVGAAVAALSMAF